MSPDLPSPDEMVEFGAGAAGRPLLVRWLAGFLVLAVFAATLLLWNAKRRDLSQLAEARFDFRVEEISSALTARLNVYVEVLRGGAGLFAASGEVGRRQWHAYVSRLTLQNSFPGLQAVGYAPDIQGSAGRRVPIAFVEPVTRDNQKTVGFDMFSDSQQRAAMARAGETGLPAITAKLPVREGGAIKPGFIMYLPVFRPGMPTETPAQRRAALTGFVFSSFQVKELLDNILGPRLPFTQLEIYDGDRPEPAALLYDSHPPTELASGGRSMLQRVYRYSLFGRRWTVYMASTPRFEATLEREAPAAILASGLTVTLLLSLVFWSLSRTRSRAVALALRMTELTRERTAQLREGERFRALFEYALEALFLVEPGGRVSDANRVASQALRYPREQLVGADARQLLLPSLFRSSNSSLPELIEGLERGERVNTVTDEQPRCDGSHFPVEATLSIVHQEGRRLLLVSMRDITERREAEAVLKRTMDDLAEAKRKADRLNRDLAQSNDELQRLSQQDALTGVANRRTFDKDLALEWARAIRDGTPISLVLLDVDHFKAYNDRYGHQAGDTCLMRVAAALAEQSTRPADRVARYGGEEFAIILPETPLDGAWHIGGAVRRAVESLDIAHAASPVAPCVTVSVGVATARPKKGESASALVRAADEALYEVKRHGRNHVHLLSVGNVTASRG